MAASRLRKQTRFPFFRPSSVAVFRPTLPPSQGLLPLLRCRLTASLHQRLEKLVSQSLDRPELSPAKPCAQWIRPGRVDDLHSQLTPWGGCRKYRPAIARQRPSWSLRQLFMATATCSASKPQISSISMASRLWREASRPFRPTTWRKWAGITPPPPPKIAPPPPVVVPPPPPRKHPRIPSMITGAEAAYFARCAERCAPMSGKIVDLGCWMGATAVALANGVHRSGSQDR